MELPNISLPFNVLDTIPLLIHPIMVHFAVVLPLIIVMLELINLITKRKSLTISVYILFGLLLVVYVGAYMSGVTDAQEASLFMSDEGVVALKSHKLVGIYLIYLTLIPIVFKVVTIFVQKPWSRIAYIVSFIGVLTLSFFQAKSGGELVFTYGANVSSQQDLADTVETLEDEIQELQERYAKEMQQLNQNLVDCNTTQSDANTTALTDSVLESNTTKGEVLNTTISTETNTTKINEVNSSK